jgi:hypothetical protein
MATLNRPDRFTLDAFSDPQLEITNATGSYYRFTNTLKTPLLNVKGVQLINANMVNAVLQLNDQSQLMFFYYASATQANIATLANLKCIRLHPSWFVPYTGYTGYTLNKYFNTGSELVSALNTAASAGGDSATYNPIWVAGQVTFAFDTTTRRISVTSTDNTTYIAPAAADDPNVLDLLRGTTTATNRIKMNAYNSSNTYASATFQPYAEGQSMNARLGFCLAYNSRGRWWGSSSQVGCATSTGVPSNVLATPVVGDGFPILLGVQNVGVYLSISGGGGYDSLGRRNLIGSIPIENAPLSIQSYTMCSVEVPSLSTPNEIYEITVELLDEYGVPFYQPFNFNTEIGLVCYY